MGWTDLIGLAAAAGSSFANIPQVLKTWRSGETGDLSFRMLAMLAAALALWCVYGALRSDWIILAANALGAAQACYLLIAKWRAG